MVQSAFTTVKPRFQPQQSAHTSSAQKSSAPNTSTEETNILDFQNDPTSPFAAMLLFAQGKPPAFLPPEPKHRCRGWGGKSLVSDDDD